ncbi:MAG: hypothetical protein AB7O52_10815 [Planctomycetota bacterium]
MSNVRCAPRGLAALGLCLLLSANAAAFDSGSDGSDGALTFAPGAGTIIFDPVALGLDTDGDNVYHFTTIDIPTGTTVRLSSIQLGEGRPVVWLATGNVTVEGTVDLDGEAGHDYTAGTPLPSTPGAGGFAGGRGETDMTAAQRGNGPGGGSANGTGAGGGGGNRTVGGTFVGTPAGSPGGSAYGNRFLLPLIGGSGGGGGSQNGTQNGAGGGAGGGAILIASSTSIVINGTVSARGGSGGAFNNAANGQRAGGGAGGAIRLVADSVTGTGSAVVSRGTGSANLSTNAGSHGWVRVEANDASFFDTATVTAGSGEYGHPGVVFLPANAPQVRVTTIDSVSVPAQTTGSFVNPDVTLNVSTQVAVNLEANNVPVGTTVNLTLRSEDGTTVTVTSTPLAGTLATSTATAGPVTFPHGFTRISVYVSFTP